MIFFWVMKWSNDILIDQAPKRDSSIDGTYQYDGWNDEQKGEQVNGDFLLIQFRVTNRFVLTIKPTLVRVKKGQ